MKRLSSPRGFTLIELMVSIGMSLAITSAALGVMLLVVDTQREGQRRNAMARDAQLVMDTIRGDLIYLGVGVPRGYEADENGNVIGGASIVNTQPGAAAQLRPPLRIATPNAFAFIGDLPFPNAELNGIAQPGMFRGNPVSTSTSTANTLSVSSQLSGCAPQATAAGANYECNTATATTIPVGGNNCHGSAPNEPSCPWALHKWQNLGTAHIPLVFGSYDGRWWRRRWDRASALVQDNGRAMITLSNVSGLHNLPSSGFRGTNVGGGFISHLDRVFYSLEDPDRSTCSPPGCVLRRRHCWGWDIQSDSPANPLFPAAGSGALTSADTPLSCAPPNSGTDWQSLVEGVKSLTFQYYDALGALIGSGALNNGQLARVKTIRVNLTLERDMGKGKLLEYQLVRQFYLENSGGIVSSEPATINSANIGGCWAAGPLNECNPQ